MNRNLISIAAVLGFAVLSFPVMATEDDGNDFYREVGEGLKAAIERPDLEFANEVMREQDEREQQDRDYARQERADREQAERDAYQREEYERRAANPDGPF